jgi:hypothetical protein
LSTALLVVFLAGAASKAAPKAAEPDVAAATSEVQNLAVSSQQTVAIVAAGEVGVEETVAALTKELILKGVPQARIAVTHCEDVMVLPYVVKRVSKLSNFKVVIAVAILTSQGNLQSFLLDNLMGLGVESSVPIIPAVVKQDSLLEVKALVPKMAESWARSASLLLGTSTNFQAAPAVVIPPQAPATVENVNDYDTLMLHLRESLKVSLCKNGRKSYHQMFFARNAAPTAYLVWLASLRLWTTTTVARSV